MSKLILILTITLCSIKLAFSQKYPVYNMYWNNNSMFNPAATGMFNKYFASVTGYHHGFDFDIGFSSISSVIDMRIDRINSGIGLNCHFNEIGAFSDYSCMINYSYHFDLPNKHILSFGASAGIFRNTLDLSKLQFIVNGDPISVKPRQEIDYQFNSNLGALYKADRFQFGLSISQLFNRKEHQFFTSFRQLWISSSYRHDISASFAITSSVLMVAYSRNADFYISLVLTYDQFLWTGITYYPNNSVGYMAGMDIKKKFRIGYSYEQFFRSGYYRGHEIVLAVMIN